MPLHNHDSLRSKDLKILTVLFVFLFMLTACGGGGSGSNPESTDVLSDIQGLPDIPGGWRKLDSDEQAVVQQFETYMSGADAILSEERESHLRDTLGINTVHCDKLSCALTLPSGLNISYIYPVYEDINTSSDTTKNISGIDDLKNKPNTYLSKVVSDNKGESQCLKEKKALILYPVENEIWSSSMATQSISRLSTYLRDNGFEVTERLNQLATLSEFERIRNKEYSLVFIITHGGASGTIMTGDKLHKDQDVDPETGTPIQNNSPNEDGLVYGPSNTKYGIVSVDKLIVSAGKLFQNRYVSIEPAWWDDVDLSNRVVLLDACSTLDTKSQLYPVLNSKKSIGAIGAFLAFSGEIRFVETANLLSTYFYTAFRSEDSAFQVKKDFSDAYSGPWMVEPNFSEKLNIERAQKRLAAVIDENFYINPKTCAANDNNQIDKPDLVVTSIDVPSSAQPGDVITPKVTVANQGNVDAGPFNTGYYLSADSTITTSDNRISDCRHDSGRAAGESRTCNVKTTLPSDLSPGTYYFGAIADDKNEVSESDESNNTRASDNIITIQSENPSDPPPPSSPPADPPPPSDPPAPSALPDLVVASIQAPNSITVGEKASITVTIKNQGTAGTSAGSSSSTFKTGCYLSDDSILDYDPVTHNSSDFRFNHCVHQNNLGSGSTAICTCEVTFPSSGNYAGNSYYFGAIVDYFDHVWSESNEKNNTYIRSSRVQIQ